jgi:tyramine---L-glutamate ligase
MRILVHEFASGGGLAGRPVPASLGREGSAMLASLIEDLAALPGHEIVATADSRFPLATPPSVTVVTLPTERNRRTAIFDELIASVDAVWLIAPETGRSLEQLASRVERQGRMLLGPSAAAIEQASDKAGLVRVAAECGVAYPKTQAVTARSRWSTLQAAAECVGYPVVVKPARGAGCEGVSIGRSARQLRRAVDAARCHARGRLLIQEYVRGTAASVSLLADGERAMTLSVNSQSMGRSPMFSYSGGTTPFVHARSDAAAAAAIRVCSAIPGLRGYVGVDVVLTRSDVVIIEVNPRLTTAYLGARAAFDENIAAMALDACAGVLPKPPAIRRRVRFSASGRITTE